MFIGHLTSVLHLGSKLTDDCGSILATATAKAVFLLDLRLPRSGSLKKLCLLSYF